jgi:menaquinone-dependent protoporphyrinogen IX oxidase
VKTLIIYKSKYGATQQYANWLHEEISDSTIISVDDIANVNLKAYECVILGSSIYFGQLKILDLLISLWNRLDGKHVFVFGVGAVDPKIESSLATENSIPSYIKKNIRYVKLPGIVDEKQISFIERFITKVIREPRAGEFGKENLKPILDFISKVNK